MKTIAFKKKSGNSCVVLTVVIFLGMIFFPALYGFASESVHSDSITKSSMEDKNSLVEKVGTIDRMTRAEIVIDDHLYKYSDNIKIIELNGKEITLAFFSRREKVIYAVDKNYRIALLKKRY